MTMAHRVPVDWNINMYVCIIVYFIVYYISLYLTYLLHNCIILGLTLSIVQ